MCREDSKELEVDKFGSKNAGLIIGKDNMVNMTTNIAVQTLML